MRRVRYAADARQQPLLLVAIDIGDNDHAWADGDRNVQAIFGRDWRVVAYVLQRVEQLAFGHDSSSAAGIQNALDALAPPGRACPRTATSRGTGSETRPPGVPPPPRAATP